MKKNSKKNSKAAALHYDGKNSPKVVAKGSGLLAEKIIMSAEEHNIHIHKDPILLEVLSKLELGDEIPEQLYLTVAKIIAFAYFLQGKHPDNGSSNCTQKSQSNSKKIGSTPLNNKIQLNQ